MIRAAVLFCAVLAVTEGWNWNFNTTEVSRCIHNSSGPLPINVYIAGCTIQPCRLEQRRDANIEIVIRAPYEIHRMTTTIWAYLSIIPIPINLGDRGITCNFLSNTNCPVGEGEFVKHTLLVPIEEFIPVGTTVPIEFRIQDDASRSNIMCFRAVVVIVSPRAPANNKLT